MTVVEAAPAKVNLYLHVVGRRDDGYHLLDSLVVFADAGDVIRVRPDDRLSLTVEGPFADQVPSDDDNLVLRAARGLAEMADVSSGAAIVLDKRLPVAAGVGGGSADAAAALRALCDLWAVEPPPERLARLATDLGADVPACLAAVPAFLGGIGERLDPAPALPACFMVLVNPGVAVPTPPVFKARQGPFSTPARFNESPADAQAFAAALADRRNDLTDAAVGIAPPIAEVLAALAALPGTLLARMSGSGATCFGLFATKAEAERAAGSLRADHPGWWIRATRLANTR